MIRYETNYFTIAANANDQTFTYTFTTDDRQDLRAKSLFVGLNVARVRCKLVVNSVPRANVDTSYFTAGNGSLPIDFTVPAKVHMQVVLTDDTATGRANVPIIIGYDVPDER